MPKLFTVILRIKDTDFFTILKFENKEQMSSYFKDNNLYIIFSKSIDDDVFYTTAIDKTDYALEYRK